MIPTGALQADLCQDPTGPSGQLYQGQFHDEMKDGVGVLHYQVEGITLVYEGGFSKNKKHGQGILTWPDGRQYQGNFVNDEFHGQGAMSWPNGHKYVGHYVNGKKEGKGTSFLPDGSRFVGNFHQGKRHGVGTVISPDGSKTWSQWKMDQEQSKDEIPDEKKGESECSTDATSSESSCTLSCARSSSSESSSQKSTSNEDSTSKTSLQRTIEKGLSLQQAKDRKTRKNFVNNPQRWRVIDTGGVVVRVSEFLKSKQIGVIRQNEELDVIEINGRRLCVKDPVPGHSIGWVSSSTDPDDLKASDLILMKRIDNLCEPSQASEQTTQSFSKKLSTMLSEQISRATSRTPCVAWPHGRLA